MARLGQWTKKSHPQTATIRSIVPGGQVDQLAQDCRWISHEMTRNFAGVAFQGQGRAFWPVIQLSLRISSGYLYMTAVLSIRMVE
jgi:hypothetical protein